MRAGELNRRILLQSNTPTRDAMGGTVDSWATTATVWAKIEPLAGREFFEARAVNDATVTRFTIRYRAGLDSDMRIVIKDVSPQQVYDILGILHIKQRKREIQIMGEFINDESP